MSLETKVVGSLDRPVVILGDPTTAANYASILALTDALSLSGKYANIAGAAELLLNASGTYDIARSALGTTGIKAVSTESSKATFSVASVGIVPVASATDVFILNGSGTKTIRVLQVHISGVCGSAVSVDVSLVRRSTANSGGTSATPTVTTFDTNNAAGTAVALSYTANPTTGTLVGAIRSAKLNLGLTSAAGSITWDFSTRNSQAVVLRGTAQGLAVNLNGVSITSGLLDIFVEYTEE